MPRQRPQPTRFFDPLAAIDNYAESLAGQQRLSPAVDDALRKAKKARAQYRKIFYIAGGLTGVDEATKLRYMAIHDAIAQYPDMFGYAPHLRGTDPIQHPGVTPNEVRDIDYLWAAIVPDTHINLWHPVAHGNAVEAGWAEMLDIPSIHIVASSESLSRLVRGMHNVLTTIVYEDFMEDGLRQLQQYIASDD